MAYSKRWRDWLAAVFNRWSVILAGKDRQKENQETGSVKHKSNQEARIALPITRTIIDIPESVLDEQRRYQKENSADQRSERRITRTAVCAAFILAAIGLYQSYLTKQANKFSIEALKLAQGADLLLYGISFDQSHGVITYFWQ